MQAIQVNDKLHNYEHKWVALEKGDATVEVRASGETLQEVMDICSERNLENVGFMQVLPHDQVFVGSI